MTFTPKAIEAAKAIDFAKESRDLKQALADNAYPAADGSADIDNHAIPIIEATLRNVAERFLAAALAVDGLALQGWQEIESAHPCDPSHSMSFYQPPAASDREERR